MSGILGSILGPIIGGIFGAGSSAVSGASSVKAAQIQADAALEAQRSANETNIQLQNMANMANRQLAEYGYAQDLAQWHRQNEYNSPANQMALYKAAGLNPYLAQGGFTAASESPQLNYPEMAAVRIHPEVDNAEGAGAMARAQALRETAQSAISGAMQAMQLQLMQSDLDYKKAMTVKTLAQSDLFKVQKSSTQQNTDFFRDTLDFRKSLLQAGSSIAESNAAIKAVDASQPLLDLRAEMSFVQADILRAEKNIKLDLAKWEHQRGAHAVEYWDSLVENWVKKNDLMDAQKALTSAKTVEQKFVNKYLEQNDQYPATSRNDIQGFLVGTVRALLKNRVIKSESQPDGTVKYYDKDGKDVTSDIVNSLQTQRVKQGELITGGLR